MLSLCNIDRRASSQERTWFNRKALTWRTNCVLIEERNRNSFSISFQPTRWQFSKGPQRTNSLVPIQPSALIFIRLPAFQSWNKRGEVRFCHLSKASLSSLYRAGEFCDSFSISRLSQPYRQGKQYSNLFLLPFHSPRAEHHISLKVDSSWILGGF